MSGFKDYTWHSIWCWRVRWHVFITLHFYSVIKIHSLTFFLFTCICILSSLKWVLFSLESLSYNTSWYWPQNSNNPDKEQLLILTHNLPAESSSLKAKPSAEKACPILWYSLLYGPWCFFTWSTAVAINSFKAPSIPWMNLEHFSVSCSLKRYKG